MSSFQEEFNRKQKEAKDRERNSRQLASQAQMAFRGGTEVLDKDLQVKKFKDQDRIKKQEAQKILTSYQDVLTVSELQEAQLKKAEARQKQLEHQNAMSQYAASAEDLSEHELKLRRLREEERLKHQEAETFRRSVQLNDVKYQKKERQARASIDGLPSMERMKHDDDDLNILAGHVKDKAELFHSDYVPTSPQKSGQSSRSPSSQARASDDSVMEDDSQSNDVGVYIANLEESIGKQSDSGIDESFQRTNVVEDPMLEVLDDDEEEERVPNENDVLDEKKEMAEKDHQEDGTKRHQHLGRVAVVAATEKQDPTLPIEETQDGENAPFKSMSPSAKNIPELGPKKTESEVTPIIAEPLAAEATSQTEQTTPYKEIAATALEPSVTKDIPEQEQGSELGEKSETELESAVAGTMPEPEQTTESGEKSGPEIEPQVSEAAPEPEKVEPPVATILSETEQTSEIGEKAGTEIETPITETSPAQEQTTELGEKAETETETPIAETSPAPEQTTELGEKAGTEIETSITETAPAQEQTTELGEKAETEIEPPVAIAINGGEPTGEKAQTEIKPPVAGTLPEQTAETAEPETPVLETKPEPEKPSPVEISETQPLQGHKNRIRLDVLFSFGLLTSSNKPYLDNYMSAVEEVVKHTLAENPLLVKHVSFDPAYGPFVQEYSTDPNFRDAANRPNVKRVLVVAAIPVFLSNGIAIKQAREGVCNGLQASMQNGEFIAIAKRGGYIKKPSKKPTEADVRAIL